MAGGRNRTNSGTLCFRREPSRVPQSHCDYTRALIAEAHDIESSMWQMFHFTEKGSQAQARLLWLISMSGFQKITFTRGSRSGLRSRQLAVAPLTFHSSLQEAAYKIFNGMFSGIQDLGISSRASKECKKALKGAERES